MSPAGSQRERWIFRGMIDRDRELHPVPLTKKQRQKIEQEEREFESSRLFAENHRLRHGM